MTALDQPVADDVQVKEGVDQETVDAVREVGGKYKHGWSTDIEMDYAPKGLNP
ncbi:MAG: Fe-S cluster assembly protein SufB, partial [Pseudomonadota bacterium]